MSSKEIHIYIICFLPAIMFSCEIQYVGTVASVTGYKTRTRLVSCFKSMLTFSVFNHDPDDSLNLNLTRTIKYFNHTSLATSKYCWKNEFNTLTVKITFGMYILRLGRHVNYKHFLIMFLVMFFIRGSIVFVSKCICCYKSAVCVQTSDRVEWESSFLHINEELKL